MLPSVNEDDPLMQYETTPGSLADQSPMAPSAGVKRRSSTTSSVQGSADDGRDSSGRGSGNVVNLLVSVPSTLDFLYHLTALVFSRSTSSCRI